MNTTSRMPDRYQIEIKKLKNNNNYTDIVISLWQIHAENQKKNNSGRMFPTKSYIQYKQTNNNDLLEKDGGTKNCIYKD